MGSTCGAVGSPQRSFAQISGISPVHGVPEDVLKNRIRKVQAALVDSEWYLRET